jgi:hypothetical protein
MDWARDSRQPNCASGQFQDFFWAMMLSNTELANWREVSANMCAEGSVHGIDR